MLAKMFILLLSLLAKGLAFEYFDSADILEHEFDSTTDNTLFNIGAILSEPQQILSFIKVHFEI